MKSVIVVAAFVFAGAAHAKEKPFEGLYEKRRGVAALLKDTMRGAAERDTLEQTLKAIDAHYERLATEVLGENRDGVLSDACGRPADPIVRFLCALAVAQKPAGAGRLLALLRETKNLAYQLDVVETVVGRAVHKSATALITDATLRSMDRMPEIAAPAYGALASVADGEGAEYLAEQTSRWVRQSPGQVLVHWRHTKTGVGVAISLEEETLGDQFLDRGIVSTLRRYCATPGPAKPKACASWERDVKLR